MDMEQKDILSFQMQRSISSLCKNFLNMLEDLQEEYDRYFDKEQRLGGEASITSLLEPPENFLSDKHFDHLRKRILDKGGDITRELLEELDKYQVRLAGSKE